MVLALFQSGYPVSASGTAAANVSATRQTLSYGQQFTVKTSQYNLLTQCQTPINLSFNAAPVGQVFGEQIKEPHAASNCIKYGLKYTLTKLSFRGEMFLLDSHLHVNYNRILQRDIIKYLDRKSINLCWLLTWEEINPGRWEYQHLPIETVFDTYLKYPSRIIPFYAPDPHKNEASSQLENWYQKGIRGCGELKATLNWNSNEIRSLLKTVEKLKLPIVFHMEESRSYNIPYSDTIYDKLMFYGLRTERKIYRIPRYFLELLVKNYAPLANRSKPYYFPGYMLDFASLESTLKDYPNINFVAHGLMFWKYISNDAHSCHEALPKGPVIGEGIIWRLLRENSNLYADLSGPSGLNAMTRDPTNAKIFLTLFEDKILYGTDNMQGLREFLDSLRLNETTYKKIYGDNAFRITGNC